jgi:hypothetical protein
MEKQMENDLFFAREFVHKTTQSPETEDNDTVVRENQKLSRNTENPNLQITNHK